VDSGGSEVSIAKKLRQVVAANFIEIVRPDEPAAPAAERLNPVKTDETLSPFSGGFTARGPLTPELSVEEGGTDSLQAESLAESRESGIQAETPFLTEALEGTLEETPVVSEEEATPETPLLVMAEADSMEVRAEAGETASLPEIPLEIGNETPAVEPVSVAPVSSAPTERMDQYAIGYDPLPLMGANGVVDFERLVREANLPAVRFSAEQASKILSALPDDLPMRVKRMTVKATLDAVDPTAVIAPEDVVADAMLKKMHIAQYREALGEKVSAQKAAIEADIALTRAEIEAEIARMEKEIVRRQEAIAALEQSKQRAVEECGKRIHQMEEVVLFFQAEAAAAEPAVPVSSIATATANAPAPNTPEAEDELPPFMRDSAVYRLLGLEEKSEKETEEADEERGRRSRRKVALNGTGEDSL
jgi:hypothetical protein